MLHYYAGSNQIPGSCKKSYNFELPKYGPSTTDPTFYEPTATRIANMRRSAGAFQGLYDFTSKIDTKGKTKDQIIKEARDRGLSEVSSGTVDVRFSKHGMTHEEVSQVVMEQSLKAESMISDKKQIKQDNIEQLKKELVIAEAINNKLSENDNSAEESAE